MTSFLIFVGFVLVYWAIYRLVRLWHLKVVWPL